LLASLRSNFYSALQSIREQKFRAILSALGVTVGSSAIILLVSIATGVQADVTSQVRDLGVNVLVVVPGRIEDGTFNPNFGGMSYLKEIDATRCGQVPGVIRAEPFTFVGGGIRNGAKVASPLLAAATPGWFLMRPVKLQEGRVLQPQDEKADVVVLGSIAKKQLFGDSPAVGKTVEVNQRKYRVIGVTEDKKQEQSMLSFGSMQNLVYLSFHRLKQIQPDLQTDRIMIQIRPDAEPKQLIKRLDQVFQKRLDRQQFQVLTQEDLLGLVYKLMGILTWLLTGLTSIALFVGGVGIMTVMLMSVNERSSEIGIRKTVGARGADIFYQFLVESVILSLGGGTVGLLLSYLVDLALYRFTPVKPEITIGIVFLAFSVSITVGAIFGLIPALNASRKDPVAALRSI
jgi:putative ABC transport system permease protein